MSNNLRKLRIAFSATCSILCILLIALWVRSYWWTENFTYTDTSNRRTIVGSNFGSAFFVHIPPEGLLGAPTFGWKYVRANADRINDRFSVTISGGLIQVLLPYWVLALFAGSCAVLPWLRCRFSLRTLLISTTLLALLLGAVAYAIR